jgi:hypothetical protein
MLEAGSVLLVLKPSAAAETLKRALPVTMNSSSSLLPLAVHLIICTTGGGSNSMS